MTQLIEENRRYRIEFLKALYEINGGSTINLVDSHEVGRKIGITNLSEISKIVAHLNSDDSIHGDFAAGAEANAYIAFTPYGISLVENSEANSSDAVSPSSIQNTINIHGSFHGNLQSGEANTVNSPAENKKPQSSVIAWCFEHIGMVITGVLTAVLIAVILSLLGLKH
jgi:hypothetical protein